jgi:hypothetical protein
MKGILEERMDELKDGEEQRGEEGRWKCEEEKTWKEERKRDSG